MATATPAPTSALDVLTSFPSSPPAETSVQASLADPAGVENFGRLGGDTPLAIKRFWQKRVTPRVIVRAVWSGMCWAATWIFGVAALIGGLALLATAPILQFVSLGYLLEVSGRIARTGKLSSGFIGVTKAARVGGLVFGFWLLSWPLWFAASMRHSAYLIEPGGKSYKLWSVALFVLAATILCHAVSVCMRGGRLRYFFWPRPIYFFRQLFRRHAYVQARDGLWNYATSLRLPYYFWLGARGFAGALLWLVVPVSMLAIASRLQPAPGIFLGVCGAIALAVVVTYLPIVQTRFAAEGRWRALFETRAARQTFVRAPLMFFWALLLTLALALPLYLLKIEIVPREAAWLPSLLFVMSIYPARFFVGWACARAADRTRPRHWTFRWLSRLAAVPVVAFYVLFVYFTQYFSWYGVYSLYEQHAFLLPVPFLGL